MDEPRSIQAPTAARDPRISAAGLQVLNRFLLKPQEELSGAMIAKATHISAGTLYPLLARLCLVRWLEGHMEEGDASEIGRPLQRFYRLTPLGEAKARAVLAKSKRSVLLPLNLPAEMDAAIRRAGLLQSGDIVLELIEVGIRTLRDAGDPRFQDVDAEASTANPRAPSTKKGQENEP